MQAADREWRTQRLAGKCDYVSPGGAAEIRLLPSFEEGEITHARAHPGKPSTAGIQVGVGELFYVLSGEGELWRATGGLQNLTRLVPRRCVSIPPGISYQFRALESQLDFLVLTAPRWRSENWAEAPEGYWDEGGKAVADGPQLPGPWTTADLGDAYDYLAPDGSEIRLLPTFDSGGLAHCRLPSGRVSSAVAHRTVKEIWFVLAGHGEVWRGHGDDDSEVVEVEGATALTIPTGVGFQFRALGSAPLEILIGTFPRWPGQEEALPVNGPW